MTYMAPYSNCGATPQAIDATTKVSSLVGTCAAQNGSSGTNPVGNPSDVNNGDEKPNKNSEAESISIAWTWIGVLGALAVTGLVW